MIFIRLIKVWRGRAIGSIARPRAVARFAIVRSRQSFGAAHARAMLARTTRAMTTLAVGHRAACRRAPRVRARVAAASETSHAAAGSFGFASRRRRAVVAAGRDRVADVSSGIFLGSGRLDEGAPRAVDANTVVLGIETSCDDTAAAVVRGDGVVLGEAIASQAAIHGPWGGVVPNLARAAHEEVIDDVVRRALTEAGVSAADLSAVAVTCGPGLSMCLRVGVRKAQRMSAEYGIPIAPVHHVEAHALVSRLCAGTETVKFPFLALLVSGGHNLLIKARGVGDYTILGTTLDDALGEAYDKTARLLGLPVGGGGGPALEKLALEGDEKRFKFPVPLRQRKNCDFSYAGLKTAARMAIDAEIGGEDVEWDGVDKRQTRADIAASFQAKAVKHLEERMRRALTWALEDTPDLSCVVVAGGVAANATVRSTLVKVVEETGLPLVFPPPKWCTDNGVMVAWTGCERLALGLAEAPVDAELEAKHAMMDPRDVHVNLLPRWPLGEKDARATGDIKSGKKARIADPLTGAGHRDSGIAVSRDAVSNNSDD